jgi:serine/threonine protein kinase
MTAPLGPGDRVSRYRIEGVLGEGGMGRVYRAFDERLKRRVALKLLLAPGGDEGLDAAASARVLQEAQMAAALDHANVVAVFDSGEEHGVPFIVMELVSGTSLQALVGESSLPPSERVRIVADVARALAAAHRAGLIHRDIKPENVMIREDGTVKVLDFGIARAMEAIAAPDAAPGEAAVAGPSAAFGTPAYMPPERLLRGQYDARADQFAWGVLAYELLAGRYPWRTSPGHSLIAAILDDAPEPLSDAAIGTPPGLVAIVARALRKSADERFPTMDALIGELARVSAASGLVVPRSIVPAPSSGNVVRGKDTPQIMATGSGRSPTLPMDVAGPTVSVDPLVRTTSPSTTSARRSRRWWIAGLATAAVAATGAGLVVSRRAHPAAYAVGVAKRLTFEGCAEFPSGVGAGSTVVFDASVGKDDQLFSLDVASGARRQLTSDDGWHIAPQVSPDGRSVAYLLLRGAERATYVMPVDGSAPARLVTKGNVRPSWSPDGTAIWAGDPTHAVRVAMASLTETRVLEPLKDHLIRNVLELPDGRAVARVSMAGSPGYVGIVIRDHGDYRWLVQGPVTEVLALTPDGRSVLASRTTPDDRSDLWQLPIDGGAPFVVANSPGDFFKGVAVIGGGHGVAWSSCGTGTRVLSVEHVAGGFGARSSVETAIFGKWQDRDVVAVPGTQLVVVVSDRTGAKQPWVLDRDRKQPPRQVDIGPLIPTGLDVSQDGKWLVFSTEGHGIHLASLAPATTAVTQLTQGGSDTTPVFARGDESVYFTSSVDGTPEIREVPRAGGASRQLIPGASRPSVAPDGVVGLLRRVSVSATVPETWDPKTEARTPLAQGLEPGEGYGAIRFSPDGRHALLRRGDAEVLEIDRASRTISATFDAGIDSVSGITYSGGNLVVSLTVWEGDLWTAPLSRL